MCDIENSFKNGDEIYFQKWSNRDFGRGLLYSTDGVKPDSELLVQLEPLNNINWYFYEEE